MQPVKAIDDGLGSVAVSNESEHKVGLLEQHGEQHLAADAPDDGVHLHDSTYGIFDKHLKICVGAPYAASGVHFVLHGLRLARLEPHGIDMQKYGKELSNQLIGENKEWLRGGSDYTSDYARRGLIKSMGMSYGDQIGGAAGELFKAAWGAEIDRHTEVMKTRSDYTIKDEGSVLHSNILKNGADYMYDVFSKVDTSSKENALNSYKALSKEIDAAISKFLGQYTGGVPGGLAAKMRAEVDSYFYDLMGFKSVDVQA